MGDVRFLHHIGNFWRVPVLRSTEHCTLMVSIHINTTTF